MLRKLSKEAVVEITREIVRSIAMWAIPPAICLIGFLQNVPWFYVAVGVILSGAGVMTWLVQFDEWKSRNRVEHKLLLKGMKIHLSQANNLVVAVRFGFDLQNSAAFPIRFRVENLKTHLVLLGVDQSVFPPNKEYTNNDITISPGGIGFFFDHDIVAPQGYKGLEGLAAVHLKCKISYGKADRFDHVLEIDKNTVITFLGPTVDGGQHWYDQVPD